MLPLEWTTVKVKVGDIKLPKFNPRTITESERNKLMRYLEEFNLVEIPVLNTDKTCIAGSQRTKCLILLGRENEEIDVRWPNRKLSKAEVKKYMIIGNNHQGDWDFEALKVEFSEFDLADLGIHMPVDIDSFDTDKFFSEGGANGGGIANANSGQPNKNSIILVFDPATHKKVVAELDSRREEDNEAYENVFLRLLDLDGDGNTL